MKTKLLFFLTLLSFNLFSQNPQGSNITWNQPGNSSKASMPLGNGDIGLNLWTDDQGNISFFISKTDAWEENGRLLKIGKVDINLSPNPFPDKNTFVQTLNLHDGTIEISAGKAPNSVGIKVWVDANNPVIHFDASVPERTRITAKTDIWRTEADTIKKLEISDINFYPETYGPTVIQPDVLMNLSDQVAWYHQNPELPGFRLNLKAQGLDGFNLDNPLKDRIFGAVMSGKKFVKKDNTTLISKKGKERSLAIVVLTQQPTTPEKWLAEAENIRKKDNSTNKVQQHDLHKNWWHNFWQRSWIDVSCSDTITTPLGIVKQGDVLSRGYALQRFVNACGSRGKFPVKFNGSIFTVDYDGTESYGDYRRWGTGYWWQNTRLPLLSMPASGDFEMMQPLFNMYAAQLPLAKYRTNMAFGHEGAYFAECVYFWGAVFTESWGNKPISELPDCIQQSRWHKFEWVSGLELVSMMYDYYLYTQDIKFVQETMLPLAEQVVLFFEQHYDKDENGLLKFEPSQALETWWDCTNALPEVAGMNYLAMKLKSLPTEIMSESLKDLLSRIENILPPIPTRLLENKEMLAPAQRFENKPNVENPELYAVFPFKLYGKGKPDIELAINAYYARTDSGFFGWRQEDIFASLLGLTDEAKRGILIRASNWDKQHRFPAFWGPNYDWTPDQTHGGVLLKTLQVMLMQCDEREINLLPSWPKEWDVNFKLHAPNNTTVECIYKNGKIEKLVVMPEWRMKDVVLPEWN
jgi:hypothetical protein